MIQLMLDLGEIGVDLNIQKVPDGKQDHQNIFELEDRFDNSGRKQGIKYDTDQRMKTLGY